MCSVCVCVSECTYVCVLTMGASIFMFSSGTLCVRFQVPTSGNPNGNPLSLVSSTSILQWYYSFRRILLMMLLLVLVEGGMAGCISAVWLLVVKSICCCVTAFRTFCTLWNSIYIYTFHIWPNTFVIGSFAHFIFFLKGKLIKKAHTHTYTRAHTKFDFSHFVLEVVVVATLCLRLSTLLLIL